MNNTNLPVEIENNIFKRFINFIKRIFSKSEQKTIIQAIVKDDEADKDDKPATPEFLEKLRVEGLEEKTKDLIEEKNKKEKMKELINTIEGNPDKLEELDIEKLETINKYYDEKILQLDKEIEELKVKLAS